MCSIGKQGSKESGFIQTETYICYNQFLRNVSVKHFHILIVQIVIRQLMIKCNTLILSL